MNRAIYWFRSDLRLNDNRQLYKAVKENREIIPIFIFDEKLFLNNNLGFSRISPHRINYLQNTLIHLNNEIEKVGGQLLVYIGNPVQVLTYIGKFYKTDSLYSYKGIATYEQMEDQLLLTQGFKLQQAYNTIFQPQELPFTLDKSPYYYTKFKNIVQHLMPIDNNNIEIQELHTPSFNLLKNIKPIYSFDHTILDFNAGEVAGNEAAKKYLKNHASHYSETRELFEGNNSTSELSPFLSSGSISLRSFYMKLINTISTSPDNSSFSKLKEQLLWNEYYKYLFLRYPGRFFQRAGVRHIIPKMYDDITAFNQWRNGKTENLLVNAIMNELKERGFIKNRSRMIAASYLTKDLNVNWLWGAQWFEYLLIDYDVCNNYGNWAYIAGTGTNSRINRKLNPDRQREKFDPDRNYINKWKR